MPTNAFTSGITVNKDVSATAGTYDQTLEEVQDFQGLGATNELIEVTHFGSGGSKEYIAGLADGDEITIQCNKVNTASSVQSQLIAETNAKETRGFEVTLTDGTDAETYTFQAALLSWKVEPSVSDKNTISFTAKVSGGITIA